MVTSVGSSIVTALGGSSIDTANLVDQLATANIASKKSSLTAKETANTAQISDLATVVNTISSFSSSLSTLIASGTLFTQPTSSNTSIVQVSAVAGARLAGLSSTLQVNQLAAGQALSSPPLGNAATAVGQGTLLLTVGSKTATITIDSTNDSLAGLALAIKNSGLGVSASTVTDSSGTRLVVKGATGSSNGFSLALTSGSAATLGRFTFDPTTYDPMNVTGFTRTQTAQDALLNVDGVSVVKSSNSFSDVLDGVQINLQSAAPGTTISIGANQPTSALTTAITDFVSAYNEMKATLTKVTDPTTGSLKSNSGMRQLIQKMGQLSSTPLTYATDGSPTTLAEIGVSTNRDGTLALDAGRLATIMASNPSAVEAMFNPSQRSDNALIQITSPVGKTAGGIYTITNASAATSSSAAHATIDGTSALPSGNGVIASFFSTANGLAFTPLGDVASATITIDTGLAGALTAIQTSVTSSTGLLTVAQNSLATQKTTLAADEDKLTQQDTAYRATLTKQFTAMQTALLAYSSTQSFLTQQIKAWQNTTN